MKLTYIDAYDIAIRGWREEIPDRDPTMAEIFAVVGVGALESGWGQQWGKPHAPDMVTSKNWGAVQCTEHARLYRLIGVGKMPDLSASPVPSAVAGCCAMCVDSRPTSDGKSEWYVAPYKCYPSHEEGCRSIIRLLERMGVLQEAREKRIVYAVSAKMYDKRYYQGFGATREERIAGHVKRLALHCSKLALALDPNPGRLEGLSASSTPAVAAPAVERNPAPYVVQPPVIELDAKTVSGLAALAALDGIR